MKLHFTQPHSLNPISIRKSNRSKYQYFPHRVVPYIDISSRTGLPVHQAYLGNKIPKILGIATNILVLILACRKAPTKSSCFTRALSLLAWARNIFKDQKEAVGDHLSSVILLSCKSPLTTSPVLSLSRDPSLFTLTLKISITGVLVVMCLPERYWSRLAFLVLFSPILTILVLQVHLASSQYLEWWLVLVPR